MPMINVADLKDPSDPQGRSYRQVNAEKMHTIPIGALVEILDCEGSEGVRLFVVHHGRDCDETPTYCLCHQRENTLMEDSRFRNHNWTGGYGAESLKVIRLPWIGGDTMESASAIAPRPPVDIEAALEALRKAGGDGWDAIDDPAAYIKEVTGE